MVSHCPAKAANLRVIRVRLAAAPPNISTSGVNGSIIGSNPTGQGSNPWGCAISVKNAKSRKYLRMRRAQVC